MQRRGVGVITAEAVTAATTTDARTDGTGEDGDTAGTVVASTS
jgi:hypothetical protein